MTRKGPIKPPGAQDASAAAEAAMAKEAQGAAVMLLTAVGAALAMGYVVHRLHGGPYIPVVIPALCGAAFGGLLASVRARFEVKSGVVATATCALAAFVFVATFQALIYLRSVEMVAGQVSEGKEMLNSWWGFLTWTSTTELGAELSPLGVLGRLSVTPVLVVSVIVVEVLAALGAAQWAQARRSRAQLASDPSPPAVNTPTKREQLGGRLDTEHLLAGLTALDEAQVERAATHLGGETPGGEHVVYLTWTPHSQAAWLLEVMAVGDDGHETLTASRQISSWDGQLLMDEVRAGARG